MKKRKSTPPDLAQRLLHRFLRDELAEEVRGDLEENFHTMLRDKSMFRARIGYWYQVMNYLRPFALKRSRASNPNQYTMLQNYFKIGWRNLSNQRMYSAIKIGGFALGIAACFLIALFIRDELSYDLHFPKGERIYRVLEIYNDNGEIGKGAWRPAPFAAAIKEDYPEIERVGRTNPGELFGAGSNEIRRDDQEQNTFEEGFVYFDQELLEMLGIPVLYGNPARLLSEPNSMVITRRMSDKYFPDQNPVGKVFIVNNNEERPFTIGGVIEDFPATSHIHYDFLMTLSGREFWKGEQSFWGANNYHTYIMLRPGADASELEAKMQAVTEKYVLPMLLERGVVDAREEIENVSFELQPLRDIYLKSEGVDDRLVHGDIRFVWLFGAVAIIILVIACINFINLSTAKSANRAKEVGLRKVVGSFRSNLISQFLTESLLFSFLSFVLGVIIAWLLLPYFNTLAAKSLIFPWKEWWLLPMLASSTIVIGILAGLYPSIYLSSFKPIQILKGNLSKGSKSSPLRSTLVIFQFTTSIILIIGTIVIDRQMGFILNKKVGYEKDQVLIVQGANGLGDKIITFKNELLRLPHVKNVSMTDYLPVSGTKRNQNGFWKEGKEKEDKAVYGQRWRVDHDYIKTMGMKIVQGRDFSYDIHSDSQAVIINQAMAKEFGFKDPIGARITRGGPGSPIIGVVEDFNSESLKESIRPLALFINGGNPASLVVKINGRDMAEAIQSVTATWKQFSPKQPMRYAFLDDRFAMMYADVQRMGRIFSSFAVLAIIVACLGLFALSAFMVEQRSKEISIRLVLGASVNSIFGLLTRNFLLLVLVSLVIAVPLAWYLMHAWLEDFVYRIEISWDVFLLSGMMAAGIAILTISYQSIRAGLMNPITSLKSE